MKRGLYRFVGYGLISISLFIIFVNIIFLRRIENIKLINLCLDFFNGCPASMGINLIYFVQALDYVISLGIIALFIVSGIYFIKIKETNKITNWAGWLTLTGELLFISVFLIFGIICSVSGAINPDPEITFGLCLSWSVFLIGLPFGIAPAGILYLISIILLFVDFIVKKRKARQFYKPQNLD